MDGWGAAPDEVVADAGPALDGWGAAPSPEKSHGWGAAPDELKPEMPGVLEAARQGLVKSFSEYGQGAQALQGEKPQVGDESPAAQGYEWSDVLHPSQFAGKTAYGLAHSAPSLAGGIMGGMAGTMVEPGLGTLAGGALGAGAAAAAQQVGPAFAAELKATPNDPDGAWDRAIGHAAVSGAGSAAGWALFPAKFAQGPLKNLMFQAFGVQPAVSVGEQAAQNVISDKPVTDNLGQAYAQGAVGSAIPLAGHAAVSKLMARPEAQPDAAAVGKVADEGDAAQNAGAAILYKGQLYKGEPGESHLDIAQRNNMDLDAGPSEINADLFHLPSGEIVNRQELQNRGLSGGVEDINAFTRGALQGRLEDGWGAAPDADVATTEPRTIAAENPDPVKTAELGEFGNGEPPSGAPPEPPPGPAFVPPEKQTPDPSTWDRIPFAQTLKNAATGWKKTFQPELISDLSHQASGFVREYISGKAQGNDAITNQYYELRKLFNGMEPQQQIDFMKAAAREGSTPANIPSELMPAYRMFREDLDMTGRMDQEAGSKMGWIEDYMPRMYENPEGVKQYMQSRVQAMGAKAFQKARSFDLMQDALDAGFKLRYPNPADAVGARLMAGNAFRMQMKLMRQMEAIGAAVKADDKSSPDLLKLGYEITSDPSGQKWGLHPDVVPLWSNAIAQKGLWASENLAGDIFRGWMNLKNAYVPIKLGLSAFHPLHVAHINLVHGMALGWRELLAGNPGKAFASTVKGVTGQFYFPEAKAAKQAWLTPEWRQTPEQRAVVKMMVEGGFSPQLSEQLRMAGAKTWSEALAQSDWKKMLKVAPYEAMRKTQGVIFEKWIPSLKTAAYLQEAKSLFERRPDLLDNEVSRRAALGTIAKSIDNRFGEMFYSNLHWNKMLKEAGIASFLSLGWNLGFLREFGGGMLQPFIRPLLEKTPTREAVHAAQNKTAFALIYMANAMVLNAVMQKGLSGQWPNELMDYFLPKIGGTNPDGSPRRISNMFYTREIPMMEKHIEEQGGGLFGTIKGLGNMLWNKMMFQPIKEMWDNKDYYGYQIMDPSKPEYVQLYQLGKHILSDQFNPITITGAKNALKLSGEWDDQHPLQSYGKIFHSQEGLMALMGFGPAPSYASHSEVQNKLYHLYGEYVSPQAKPQADREVMEARRDARNALRIAQQQGDPDKISHALDQLHQSGASKQSIKSTMRGDAADLYLFEKLPTSVKQQFLKEIAPQDFKKFYPKSGKQVKADPDIRELARRYALVP